MIVPHMTPTTAYDHNDVRPLLPLKEHSFRRLCSFFSSPCLRVSVVDLALLVTFAPFASFAVKSSMTRSLCRFRLIK